MKLEDYLKKADRTTHSLHSKEKGMNRANTEAIFEINHAIMGMLTELGEFADIFKKYENYGKEIDWVNAIEELGDLMWYIALASREIKKVTGKGLSEALDINIEKLEKRFPDKFTEDDAINRDVVAEREILEK